MTDQIYKNKKNQAACVGQGRETLSQLGLGSSKTESAQSKPRLLFLPIWFLMVLCSRFIIITISLQNKDNYKHLWSTKIRTRSNKTEMLTINQIGHRVVAYQQF